MCISIVTSQLEGSGLHGKLGWQTWFVCSPGACLGFLPHSKDTRVLNTCEWLSVYKKIRHDRQEELLGLMDGVTITIHFKAVTLG